MLTESQFNPWLQQAARECGFDRAGVAAVGEYAELRAFPEWIAAGHHGEMEYLAARAESGDSLLPGKNQGELKRASLRHAAPWARSVIVCAVNYNIDELYSTEVHDPARGWIARYAWSQRDYHDEVLARLRKLEAALRAAVVASGGPAPTTRCYVDTGPLVERVVAKYAGVGWIGKNTCIIDQKLGSWLFLGVILTSLELTPSVPAADRCGSCRRCIEACPTDALLEPYVLDARRCISYLTIEKRGDLVETTDDELLSGMGKQVFGCDICQDVCPWNRKAPATNDAALQPRRGLVNPALDWLAEMSAEEFRAVFRGSPVKRAKRSGLRRNAVIAMGNSGDARFVVLLEKLSEDEDAAVSLAATWAMGKLG